MSPLVDSWNALADAWLLWLAHRSLAAALAFVAVGLVLLLARRRLSAHAPSHLLLVPALLLAIPAETCSPDWLPGLAPAAHWLVDAHLPATAGDAAPSSRRTHAPSTASETAPNVHALPGDGLAPRDGGTMPSSGALLLAGWSLGVASYVLWLVHAQRRAARQIRRHGRPCDPALQELFARLCSERGFDTPVTLRTLPGLPSPLATGLVHRVVCVPDGLERSLSPTQLRFVLLHELEHHARRDVLAEGVLLVLRAAFVFHPVAWLTLALHRRWREYACDEAALARTGATERTPVADALFTLLRLAHDGPRPAGAIASLLSRTHAMKTRLARILDRTQSPRHSLSAASVLLLAVIGLGTLAIARVPAQSPKEADPASVQGDRPRAQKPGDERAVAVDQGIAWLLAAQQKDGSWDLGADPTPNTPRDHNTVHVTGLALRAVLHGYQGPQHTAVVRAVVRGDNFLRSMQDDRGLFGGGEPLAEAYGHAQVLLALCAIQHRIPDQTRLESIARGVVYAEQARNPHSGWRYRPRDNDNDSKHTALMLLALLEAKALGVPVADAALTDGRQLLAQLTDGATGRTGFVMRGTPMSRFQTKAKRFPSVYSEEPTAMRLLVEAAFKDDATDPDVLARAADLVRDMPPRWSPEDGTTDFAYWCFGAAAMAGVGGDHAAAWRRALHTTLLGSRIVEGDRAHWPADDAWSRPGMEAYSTASAVLALLALP